MGALGAQLHVRRCLMMVSQPFDGLVQALPTSCCTETSPPVRQFLSLPRPTGVDGIVKFWDLRQTAGGAAAAAAPAWDLARLCDASVPHISQKQHGITSLALHPQGGWAGQWSWGSHAEGRQFAQSCRASLPWPLATLLLSLSLSSRSLPLRSSIFF